MPAVRVIVRLPYNRPGDAPPDPPPIEWNAVKENVLWEVIAKSRAIEGAGTDWKGLAVHLQVPLPFLLHRAQDRYEKDLRRLQHLAPPAPSPLQINPPGEYFPRAPDPSQPGPLAASSAIAPTSPTIPATSTLRPRIGVRARLSSLGNPHVRPQLRSPLADHAQSPLSAHPTPPSSSRPPIKVSSSSTLTLQGPNKSRSPLLQPLSPTSFHPPSSSHPLPDSSSDDEDDSSDDARGLDEAEKQDILARKLKDLERLMTTLGLVADQPFSPRSNANLSTSRGRVRPTTSALSCSTAPRSVVRPRSPSHQSLSSASVDSPQDSIPSIPSPPAQSQSQHRSNPYQAVYTTHTRHRSQGSNPSPAINDHHPPTRSHSHSLSSRSLSHSHSDPHSPPRVSSPMPVPRRRHLATPEKSSSPPALSPGSAHGQTAHKHARALHRPPAAANLAAAGTPTTGSEASSFSDLSDASVSKSALESALMSDIKGGGGSRLSSFARSHVPGGKRPARS